MFSWCFESASRCLCGFSWCFGSASRCISGFSQLDEMFRRACRLNSELGFAIPIRLGLRYDKKAATSKIRVAAFLCGKVGLEWSAEQHIFRPVLGLK